jgi:hypothetical protein
MVTKGINSHFAPGVAFHVLLVMSKKGLIVNINDYEQVPLNATAGGIDFKNLHHFKVRNINDKIENIYCEFLD